MTFHKEHLRVWLPRIAGGLLVISYLLMLFGLCRMQLLPLKYLLIITPLTAIPVGLLAYPLLAKTLARAKLITLGIIALLVTALCLWVYSASSATFGFLSGLQQTENVTQYSIVARKNRHTTLEHNPTTGLMTTETNLTAVKKKASTLTKTSYHTYADTEQLLAATKADTTSAILQTSQMTLLKETDAATYNSLEVLATFTVRQSTSTANRDTTKPFVLYISGIDTYGDVTTVSRSDVNILAVINPQTGKMLLVTTPRDYYVQLHGTTGVKDKLTHAGIYGVEMSKQTLEDLYQTPIDYYARLNFASLLKIVDTLGGVEVYSDQAFTAGGYHFTKGTQHMDGAQALAFSRERHSFADGDRTRGKNQERVIEAIVTKLSSPAILANYQSILTAVSGSIQTNASTSTIIGFMRQQLDAPHKWNVTSIAVDGTGSLQPTYSGGSTPLYVMQPDEASVAAARQRIQAIRGN
jgi:LCP family protein required for cell wall assembly